MRMIKHLSYNFESGNHSCHLLDFNIYLLSVGWVPELYTILHLFFCCKMIFLKAAILNFEGKKIVL